MDAARVAPRVIVVGKSPEKMDGAIAVLAANGFAATGVFSEEEARRAIALADTLFAVVAGGFLDEQARNRLQSAAVSRGAVVVTARIGHDEPEAHFHEHVVPQLMAALPHGITGRA